MSNFTKQTKILVYLLLSMALASSLYATDSKFAQGEEIYKETCISCHGKDGKANTDMQLIVSPRNLRKTILTENQGYEIIKKGAHFWGSVADIMPSFESVYTEKELRSVAYYIYKSFNPNVKKKIATLYAQSDTIPQEKKSKMLKRGKKIYKRNCSWCHGTTAKGDGEATKNPELSIFPYDLTKTLLDEKQMFLYAKKGGKFWGTYKDDMPNWSNKYDDFTLKSVILYIEKEFRSNHQEASRP